MGIQAFVTSLSLWLDLLPDEKSLCCVKPQPAFLFQTRSSFVALTLDLLWFRDAAWLHHLLSAGHILMTVKKISMLVSKSRSAAGKI